MGVIFRHVTVLHPCWCPLLFTTFRNLAATEAGLERLLANPFQGDDCLKARREHIVKKFLVLSDRRPAGHPPHGVWPRQDSNVRIRVENWGELEAVLVLVVVGISLRA